MAISREIHLITPEHARLKGEHALSVLVERKLKVLDPAFVKWEIHLEDVSPNWRRTRIRAESKTPKSLNGWVAALSNAVCDYYLSSWEPLLVDRYILDCFEVENVDEMRLIRHYCTKVLADSQSQWDKQEDSHVFTSPSQGCSFYAQRRWRVLEPLNSYLEQHDELNLLGFHRFRLQDYRELLYSCVTHAVEEYIIDREYQEFISLLQAYVHDVPPKCAVIHLREEEDGTCHLYQENGNLVTEEQVVSMLQDQVVDVKWEDVAYEDLIVSILMNLSPAQIVVHLARQEHGQVFDTVKAIFQERVKVELDDKHFAERPAKHPHQG